MATPIPIVFTAPGLGPDMSIEVFKQIFHVNSMVLKIHSEYFRNYLDSPDKSPASSVSGSFKYEWVTQVDEDGTGWSLTAKENYKSSPKYKPFAGNPQSQVEAFNTIISALHNWPIDIKTSYQLCLVAEFADFYRVLPLMSNALHGVFFENHELIKSIPTDCVALIQAAYKLRNKLLFRECFIHVMGPWTHPRSELLQEKKLRDLAAATYAKITAQIAAIQYQCLIMTSTPPTGEGRRRQDLGREFGNMIMRPLLDFQDPVVEDEQLIVPAYYRKLHNLGDVESNLLLKKLKALLNPFIKNFLVLDRSGVGAGEGPYKNSFLCFELSDQELPWDIKQRVW
ncbi:hypothetical protein LOCC1_G004347 [Lachnellula occidentalis]|uniref:Uncharacterized protein n=1 Tax=Lachnellula occidentalis TaxID=215460 RepID=A0A8H8S340_9HELO|nr:hypothetical protein LOCC1_G004347 [Lachnellula occidentalis]